VILSLAILTQYQSVMDRQTDGWTHDNSIYHASIVSRGKIFDKVNHYGLFLKPFSMFQRFSLTCCLIGIAEVNMTTNNQLDKVLTIKLQPHKHLKLQNN